MNPARWAVNRPVAVAMVLGIIFILGILALFALPLNLLPEFDLPYVTVTATLPGAGPEEVENLITRPIEEALATVDGVASLASASAEGGAFVFVEFRWGTDLNRATVEMRERLDLSRDLLPEDAGLPRVQRFDPTDEPLMGLGMKGPDEVTQVRAVAEERVRPRLERLPGVASVQLVGAPPLEVRVAVHPDSVRDHGVDPQHVARHVIAHNLDLPGGPLVEAGRRFDVRTAGFLASVEELAAVQIPTRQNLLLALDQLADVQLGTPTPEQRIRLNGDPGVAFTVLPESGANPLAVSDRVQAELETLRNELPAGYELFVFADGAEFIRISLRSVAENLVLGGLLAVALLYLFLRHARSTLVVALAIPFSVVATFALMHGAGISLNLVSLGGLALGIGMMVDNAIVVLESIYREREEGTDPAAAAVDGTRKVGGAITASTLTTVAIFLPVIFAGGLAAEIFNDLALTVSFALAASLLAAWTAVPMVAVRLLRQVGAGGRLRFSHDPTAGARGPWVRGYTAALGGTARWRLVMPGVLGLLLAGAVVVGSDLPTRFMPAFDEGRLRVDVRLAEGADLERTDAVVRQLEAAVAALPEARERYTFVGTRMQDAGRSAGTHRAQIFVELNRDRQRSSQAAAAELEAALEELDLGEAVTLRVRVEGEDAGTGGPPVEVIIRGPEPAVLGELARQVAAEMEQVAGLTDVTAGQVDTLPRLNVTVDREAASALGLSPAQVGEGVRGALTGHPASRLRLGTTEYDIRVALAGEYADREALATLPLLTPLGGSVALAEVATLEEGTSPPSIQRRQRERVQSVTARMAAGFSLGAVMGPLEDRLAAVELPPGYRFDYGGERELLDDTFRELGRAGLLGVVLMYMVMAAQFESLLLPLAVMTTLPMALIGVVMALYLTGQTLNAAALVGVLLVFGVIVNNAIVLVDYVNQLRARHFDLLRAVVEASAVRLRPIVMTTLTTVTALIPLALGLGEGSELQQPLAIVGIGGLLFGTVLTLFVLPALYLLLMDLERWLLGRPGSGGDGREPQDHTVHQGASGGTAP